MTKKIILTIVAITFALPVMAQIEIDSVDQVAATLNSVNIFNTIDITSPVNGTWKKATNNTIKWKVTGLKKDFKVAFELDPVDLTAGTKVIPLIKGVEVKKGEVMINYRKIMDAMPGSYTLRMYYSGSRNLVSADTSYVGFKPVEASVKIIDADAPKLTITSPTEGAIVDASKAFRITWYANFAKKTKSTKGDFSIVPEYGVGANGQSILLSRILLNERSTIDSIDNKYIGTLVQINSEEYKNNPADTEFASLNAEAAKIPSDIKINFASKVSLGTIRLLQDVDFDQLATELNANKTQKELDKNKDRLEDITDDFDNGRTKLVIYVRSMASSTMTYKIATTNIESGSKKVNLKKIPEGRYQIYAVAGLNSKEQRFNGPVITVVNKKMADADVVGSYANLGGKIITGTAKYTGSWKTKTDANGNNWLENKLLLSLKLDPQYTAKDLNNITLLDSVQVSLLSVGFDSSATDNINCTSAFSQVKGLSCGATVIVGPKRGSLKRTYYKTINPGQPFPVEIDLIKQGGIFPLYVRASFSDNSSILMEIPDPYVIDRTPITGILVNDTSVITTPIDANRIDLSLNTATKVENNAITARNTIDTVTINSPRPNNVWYKGMKKLISVRGPRIAKIRGKDAPYDRYLVKIIDSNGAQVSDFATVDGIASQFENSSVLTMYKTATTLTLKDSLVDGNYKMVIAFCSHTRNCNNEDMSSMPNASVDFVIKSPRTRTVTTTPTASVINAVNYGPEYGNNGFGSWLNNIFR
jgi:hypothetical protein